MQNWRGKITSNYYLFTISKDCSLYNFCIISIAEQRQLSGTNLCNAVIILLWLFMGFLLATEIHIFIEESILNIEI